MQIATIWNPLPSYENNTFDSIKKIPLKIHFLTFQFFG